MKEVVYESVSNSRFSVQVADDKLNEVKELFDDPGLRGRIGALLTVACNEVLRRELGPYFNFTQEATK